MIQSQDMRPRKKRRKDVYKVLWLGKDPLQMYSKVFPDKNHALKFADGVKNSMVFKLEGQSPKSKSSKHRILLTDQGKEFVRSINLHRKLEGKGKGFANASGVAEVGVVTTTEYRNNQRARLVNTLAIAPLLIYGGYKLKDASPRWIGYAIMGVGVLTMYRNGKNFMTNRNN